MALTLTVFIPLICLKRIGKHSFSCCLFCLILSNLLLVSSELELLWIQQCRDDIFLFASYDILGCRIIETYICYIICTGCCVSSCCHWDHGLQISQGKHRDTQIVSYRHWFDILLQSVYCCPSRCLRVCLPLQWYESLIIISCGTSPLARTAFLSNHDVQNTTTMSLSKH
jgi:hypothetical protein